MPCAAPHQRTRQRVFLSGSKNQLGNVVTKESRQLQRKRYPIHTNQLEAAVLFSVYLTVLEDKSEEEQFIDAYNTYKRLVYHTAYKEVSLC